MNRKHSPLLKDNEAIEIDTTNLNIDEQVNLIIKTINKEQTQNMSKEEDRIKRILFKYDKDNKRINKLILKYPEDVKVKSSSPLEFTPLQMRVLN